MNSYVFNELQLGIVLLNVGFWPVQTPTQSPTRTPTVISCLGDRNTWNAGYGDCTTYAPGQGNADYCGDTSGGLSGYQACSECGTCADVKEVIMFVQYTPNANKL
jgi:hypothetical protein